MYTQANLIAAWIKLRQLRKAEQIRRRGEVIAEPADLEAPSNFEVPSLEGEDKGN